MSIKERFQNSSYQAEVYFSREWHGSGNRFATAEEAETFGYNLAATWNPAGFIKGSRVERVKEPPNVLLDPKTKQAVTLAVEDADEDYGNVADVSDDGDVEEEGAAPPRSPQRQNREALFRRRVEELEERVRQRKDAWDEARVIYDRKDLAIEMRQAAPLIQARDAFREAMRELKQAKQEFEQELAWIVAQAAKVEAEERRLIRQAPSSLQGLVAYGTYDKVPREAWAKFDAEMAEWKAKMRAGEFDAKIWR